MGIFVAIGITGFVVLFALMTTLAGHRWGMASVMPFLVIGALILLTVDTKKVDPDTIL